MALSEKAKKLLEIALGGSRNSNPEVAEILSAFDSAANPVSENVADLGITSDLSSIAGTYADGAEPTGAEVDATVQGLADETEGRLDAIEAKVDEFLQAQKASGQMEQD